MTATSVTFLVLTLAIVWGGLVASVLYVRARPEADHLPPGGEEDPEDPVREQGGPVVHDT
ncbi:MetS family NSS transporter small subunit [Cellulomonas sp. PhB143]|uniref:MetS family NSS transporter small subunit n=1 Tax=Cellulomonas sp. PhB143 TaxID=2485186 RepID=UPI000F47E036|nr:MetS family NSS transporter small subunit [Cellulomonas sp. PhB143]ROS73386.1 hypothetical protein EDF32_2654 [Cellulomonas sp. PhB143]